MAAAFWPDVADRKLPKSGVDTNGRRGPSGERIFAVFPGSFFTGAFPPEHDELS